jgi:hypothetical protein
MVMEELYRKIEQLTINEDPLLIAGIMMAQSTRACLLKKSSIG